MICAFHFSVGGSHGPGDVPERPTALSREVWFEKRPRPVDCARRPDRTAENRSAAKKGRTGAVRRVYNGSSVGWFAVHSRRLRRTQVKPMTVEWRDPAAYASASAGLTFSGFIRRVRGGDEHAAVELVERYGPAIRRAVRIRLRDPRLHRLIESVDICQSVFASFFVRTALGQYDLENPDQLLKLLTTIARNKLAHQARRERADCRDQGRVNRDAAVEEFPAPSSSPSPQVGARELLSEARRRLTAEERTLLERRSQGQGWSEIAAELGGTPDALRIRLARAVARVTRELGLDEAPNE
jgi:RNA polymerase sigma-70 factor (ECF subfamily)